MALGKLLAGSAVVAAAAVAGCGSSASSQSHPAHSGTDTSAPQSSPASPVSPSTRSSPRPSATALTAAQVASLVRTLYYNESQAYQESLKDGFAYDLAHDYPGSVYKHKYLACAQEDEIREAGQTETFVPEISTMAPDPAWIGPPPRAGDADWAFTGKKPKGTTYILTVDGMYTTESGQQDSNQRAGACHRA